MILRPWGGPWEIYLSPSEDREWVTLSLAGHSRRMNVHAHDNASAIEVQNELIQEVGLEQMAAWGWVKEGAADED